MGTMYITTVSTTIIDLFDRNSVRANSWVGGKARRLAELHARGFRVPQGFVVSPTMAISAKAEQSALIHHARVLGEKLAVRSSANTEDTAELAAPGLFESVVPCELINITAAMITVRQSAQTIAAKRYSEFTQTVFPSPMAVVVQAFVEGATLGTLYAITEGPGTCESPSDMSMFEVETHTGELSRDQELELRALSIQVMSSLAMPGLDLEWVYDHDGTLWLVQARPLSRGGSPTITISKRIEPAKEAFAFAEENPTVTWRWDAAHNPLPLSQAHRGLVEWVREHADAQLELACGYLYESVTKSVTKPLPLSRVTESSRPVTDTELAVALESTFFSDVVPRIEDWLELAEFETHLSLGAALNVFTDIYRVYVTEVRPLVALAKQRRGSIGTTLRPSIGAGLWRALAGDRSFSAHTRSFAAKQPRDQEIYWFAHAPRWDIAAPCFEENASSFNRFCRDFSARSQFASNQSGGFVLGQNDCAVADLVDPVAKRAKLANVVHAVSELDDRMFYRGQRLIRRAILSLPGEVDNDRRFDLCLKKLLEWEQTGSPPAAWKELTKANREKWRGEALLSMPSSVCGDRWSTCKTTRRVSRILRGRGSGGQANGQVLRLDDRVELGKVGKGNIASIIVSKDLSPGEIVHVVGAGGIVLESNRLLGHAAAMARELDIPIVIGVDISDLNDGEMIWLDGQAGLVVRSLAQASSQ